MKTSILYLLIGLLLGVAAHAQQVKPEGMDAQNNLQNLASDVIGAPIRTFDERYAGVKGSPYLLDKWQIGTLFYTKGQQRDNVKLKFNTYQSEVEALREPKGDSVVVDRQTLQGFSLAQGPDGGPFIARKVPINGQPVFLEVVHEGKKGTLFCHHRQVLLKANYKGAYNPGRTQDELIPEKDFYWANSTDAPQKIKPNKKGIAELFPKHAEALDAFIKQEKIDLKERDGLRRLAAYLDTLP